MHRSGSVDKLTFASKIDGWLLVVLLASALACLYAASAIVMSETRTPLLVAAFVVLLGCILPVWLLVSTQYTLSETELEVRSGPFRWQIPIPEVHRVSSTRNPLSSPALSLDRLRIDYGDGRWIMISPLEKERFVRGLDQRRARLASRPD